MVAAGGRLSAQLLWIIGTFTGTTILLFSSTLGKEWGFLLYTIPVFFGSLTYGWHMSLGLALASLFFTLLALGTALPAGFAVGQMLPLFFKAAMAGVISISGLLIGKMVSERETNQQKYCVLYDEHAVLRTKLISADENLQRLLNTALEALTIAVEAKDWRTRSHLHRVAAYATALARELGLGSGEIDKVRQASLLHDLGKIGIRESILEKPDKLTAEEYAIVKTHPIIAHNILSNFRELHSILPLIVNHHEYYNGKGYPYRLSHQDIPFGARIIAVADAYDAMTSDRPYRAALTRDEAVAELKRCSGTQFDPKVVEAFLTILDDDDPDRFGTDGLFGTREPGDKELTFGLN